ARDEQVREVRELELHVLHPRGHATADLFGAIEPRQQLGFFGLQSFDLAQQVSDGVVRFDLCAELGIFRFESTEALLECLVVVEELTSEGGASPELLEKLVSLRPEVPPWILTHVESIALVATHWEAPSSMCRGKLSLSSSRRILPSPPSGRTFSHVCCRLFPRFFISDRWRLGGSYRCLSWLRGVGASRRLCDEPCVARRPNTVHERPGVLRPARARSEEQQSK